MRAKAHNGGLTVINEENAAILHLFHFPAFLKRERERNRKKYFTEVHRRMSWKLDAT